MNKLNTKIKMQFDPNIAKDTSVNCALMFSNIDYWVEHNRVNERNYYDGYYWTYNTTKAFTKLYPFWTEKQIRNILKILENKGYIKSGNYNKYQFDRTKWYTCIDQKVKLHLPKWADTFDQTGRPIPNRKPNRKPNNKYIKSNDLIKTQSVYDFYIDKFKKNKNAYKLTDKRKQKIKARLNDAGLEMIKKAINNTVSSSFHLGDNDRGWQADLDFIVRSYEQVERLANMTPKLTEEQEYQEALKKFKGVRNGKD
jgi:hypothetical protein